VGIVVVVEFAAPFVLHIFGPGYAENGTTALRLLILVGPSYVIKDHYVAIRRAQRRLAQAARVMSLGTAAEAVGAVVGGVLGGMTGLCIGWAIAASCEAIVLSPSVAKIFRRAPSAVPDELPH
jgi:O-antigen/teichoic acid export membrane protein